MSPPIDAVRPVRPGEELDLERLAPWLRERLGVTGAEVQVAQFPGGHSNLTYLITVDGRGYALRRPPFGSKVKSAHDMGREVRVLAALSKVTPRVPRPVAFCDDESVIGARFYLMERIEGVILRKDSAVDERDARGLCEALVDTLAELHALDYRAVGLADFGKPDGYVQRQVDGWTRRYADARTDDIPEMAGIAEWLAAHLPPSPPPAILHNDYKFDNLILDANHPTRIIGILDWEMSTVGDPLMDLGTALCYWVEAGDPPPILQFRFGPTHVPGMLGRRQLAERYAATTGRDLEHILFYYCFGLYKTAVVAQQIYFRYAQGLTKDARFAQMLLGVHLLAQQATQAIRAGAL